MKFTTEISWDDIPQIQKLLEWRVVSNGLVLNEEIWNIVDDIKLQVEQIWWGTTFLYCKNWEKVLWIVWFKELNSNDINMLHFAQTKKPAELVNLFSLKDSWVSWIWKHLISELKKQVKNKWFTEIILNSWPRYQNAWWFYDKVIGERIWEIQDRYWKWRHAPVWSKVL